MTTAAYDAAAAAFSTRVQWLVEIDLPVCSLNYTSAPCTAIDAGDGSRCYNTWATCQDPTNYAQATKTYRFCLADVPWPDPATAVHPYLTRLVSVPQKVDPSKLFVFPERLTLQMRCDWDVPAGNNDSTLFNTGNAGEFWRNIKARHKRYLNRGVRVLRGFYESGFLLADFAQVGPEYRIKGISVSDNGCTVTVESPLSDLNERQVPFPISEDNTIQDAGGISSIDTSVTVLDASEYPDPADYTRNTVYIRLVSAGNTEICEVTNRNTTTNVLTIDRAELGTSPAAHAAGTLVEHVAYFGTAPSSAQHVTETIQDLLEWAGVASGDVDTAAFDLVKDSFWPFADVQRTVSKPLTVAKHMQALKASRGLIIYLDNDGKWTVSVVAPNESPTEIDPKDVVSGSVSVVDNEADRVTRGVLFYDPNDANPGEDPAKYDKSIAEIDATLETPQEYEDPKEARVFDPWLDPDVAVARGRILIRRYVTRYRNGVRIVTFRVGMQHSTLNVGSHVLFTTRHILDRDGNQEARPLMITGRKEVARNVLELEAIDVNFSGRYMRIGPDTMAAGYDSATASDKTYGYWGDSDNRVGTKKEEGYIYY